MVASPLDAATMHMPDIANAHEGSLSVLRYELPLAKIGEGGAASTVFGLPVDADFRQGNLRVHVLEADGLPSRADGSPCQPYATVAVAELTRRRTRRTRTIGSGPNITWGESFDFETTSACGQVVVDVWDKPSETQPADMLGKALLSLCDCRPGVPHTYFKHLLVGKVVIRVLFDFEELPTLEEEAMQYEAQKAAALKGPH